MQKASKFDPKIFGRVAPHQLDLKRMGLPGVVLKVSCEACHTPLAKDFGDDASFGYPDINAPTTVYVLCECGHETPVQVQINMSLSLVTP